jgi:hypothetical protein
MIHGSTWYPVSVYFCLIRVDDCDCFCVNLFAALMAAGSATFWIICVKRSRARRRA